MLRCPSHLQEDDKDEVDVGHSVELLVEVQRQEGEDVVLGRPDGVALRKRRAALTGAPRPGTEHVCQNTKNFLIFRTSQVIPRGDFRYSQKPQGKRSFIRAKGHMT